MKKSITIAVLVGALGLFMAPSVGAGDAQAPDREARHNMDLNTASGIALDVALGQCNAAPDCIAYGAFPCRKPSKHKAICLIHIVRGPSGNQAAQVDCHRELGLKLRRRSFNINTFFLSEFHCSTNTEHPGQ